VTASNTHHERRPRAEDRLDVDLSDPAVFAQGAPLEHFAYLRQYEPVHRNRIGHAGEHFWSITRFEDIAAASKDWATYSSTGGSTIPSNAALGDLQRLMMVSLDPPRHTQRRNIVHKVFTPRAVSAHEPAIAAVMTGLLDRVARGGHCDLVADIAVPFPLVVIAAMLGVSQLDYPKFFRWSTVIGDLAGSEDAALALTEAMGEMGEYLQAFIAKRREDPKGDLISKLIHAEVDGVQLNDLELLVSFAELMVAGNETTRSTLAGGVLLLLEHPDELERLRADPLLVNTAVEEILRFWAPVNYQARTATRDVVLRDREISAGDRLALWFCSANRDPAMNDRPNRFDLGRPQVRHIAFGGGGPHFCLGAGLARLELRVGLQELVRRLPDLTLGAAPTVQPSTFFHALGSLPVRFAAG
jgi:cytochrome P450